MMLIKKIQSRTVVVDYFINSYISKAFKTLVDINLKKPIFVGETVEKIAGVLRVWM